MDFKEFVSQILSTILNVLIIPLIPAITAYFTMYLKKKTLELENKLKSKEASVYLDIVEKALDSMVSSVDQKYVDDLKAANGNLTVQEQKNAFELARSKAVSAAGEAAVTVLSQVYKDSGDYLKNRIEYYVNLNKSSSQEVLK